MIIIIMDYGVNCNGMDGEFKGNILILETGKILNNIIYILKPLYRIYLWDNSGTN